MTEPGRESNTPARFGLLSLYMNHFFPFFVLPIYNIISQCAASVPQIQVGHIFQRLVDVDLSHTSAVTSSLSPTERLASARSFTCNLGAKPFSIFDYTSNTFCVRLNMR